MELSSSLSAMSYFNQTSNHELYAKVKNLMKLVILFTSPLPSIKSGLMKLADMLPISDDCTVDSSLYSQNSESEGGIWDYQENDDVSIAPEGAQLIPLDDDDGNRTSLVSSQLVGQGHEGARPPPKIIPTPTTAPEGATC
jgi:hypothetical protein